MRWLRLFKKLPKSPNPPVTLTKKEVGAYGEELARKYLEKNGYRVLETNYRCPLGEIDIVALHKKELVFIEVRTKSGTSFGSPEESVTRAKKEKLASLAYYYLQHHSRLPSSWRIDMVPVELDGEGKVKRIEIIENALA
ncbi:MAG: YraN family protein [Dehalococcoidia bacterium]|nr:YraN family protein [Dehalococcoidia bacterium]MDZ4247143.1 YraN family protein [Dehalococcoidia bacterium]